MTTNLSDDPATTPQPVRRKRKRQTWRRRIIGDCILYCVVAMALFFFADLLILHPSNNPMDPEGGRRIELAGPNGKLEIWKYQSQGINSVHPPQAYVLTFIGNASRAEGEGPYVAEQWGNLPVEVWGVNYPGYGGSEGWARMASIAPAALAAFDEIKKHAGAKPVFVAGRSIGTTAALYVAAHRPVDGVILHSPPPLRQLIMRHYGWWNLWLAAIPVSRAVPSDLDSIENARHSTAPAIFLMTGKDSVVPAECQQMVIDAYAGQSQIIRMPETDHNDFIPNSAMKNLRLAYKSWLKGNTLPTTSTQPSSIR